MNPSFLITGASGNVGQAVLSHLPADAPYQLYQTTHHPHATNPGQRWLDFENPRSFSAALQHIDVVLLIRPPQLADVKRYFAPFISACQQALVKQVVFLSVQGADQTPYIPHAKIEALLRQSGLAYTFIRPSYFMQNLTTTLKQDIRQHHRLFLPAGQARFLWVDVDDIGRAVAVVLANWTQHQGRIYTITGSQLLTFSQVSALLSEQIGYRVHFESPNLLRFYWTKRAEGLSSGLILVMMLLHYLPRFQTTPGISPDFSWLTGRQPNTLVNFIHQHRSDWT